MIFMDMQVTLKKQHSFIVVRAEKEWGRRSEIEIETETDSETEFETECEIEIETDAEISALKRIRISYCLWLLCVG